MWDLERGGWSGTGGGSLLGREQWRLVPAVDGLGCNVGAVDRERSKAVLWKGERNTLQSSFFFVCPKVTDRHTHLEC